jgi:hypothetical protein
MQPQPMILESQNAMSAADGATTESKIRISRPDDGNARCKVSRALGQRKDFSACSSPQHLQRPTSSRIGKNAPSLSGLGDADVARSRRRSVSPACQQNCYVLYSAM